MPNIFCADLSVPNKVTLEMILSHTQTGVLNGPYDIIAAIKRSTTGEVLWEEEYKNTIFRNGGSALILGSTLNEINPDYFAYTDIELILTIGENTVKLPVVSVPYAIYSINADAGYSLANTDILYFDRVQNLVGIGTTAPATKLDVNGAVKLGNEVNAENGTMRWTGQDLELRKNNRWISLAYESNADDESKWLSGDLGLSQKVSRNLGINTPTPSQKLEVIGNSRFTNYLLIEDDLIVTNSYEITSAYHFNIQGELKCSGLSLGVLAFNNWTNGNVYSFGQIYAEGSGLTNIGTAAFNDQIITSIKIADGTITPDKIIGDAIIPEKIQDQGIISPNILTGTIENDHIADNAITTEKIQDYSIAKNKINENVSLLEIIPDAFFQSQKFSDYAITTAELGDNSILAHHIVSESVTTEKIADYAVTSEKINTAAITEAKIATDSVTSLKMSGPVSITKGGTGKTSYTEGSIVYASSSLLAEDPERFIWDSSSDLLGIGTANPTEKVHIMHSAQDHFVIIQTTNNMEAGIRLKNSLKEWILSIDNNGLLGIKSSALRDYYLHPNFKFGTSVTTSVEQFEIKGAIQIGNSTNPIPQNGTLRFNGIDFEGYNGGWSSAIVTPTVTFSGLSFGKNLTVDVNNSIIGGGYQNQTQAALSAVGGGHSNIAMAQYSIVLGGLENEAQAEGTAIGGGYLNIAKGTYSFIGGGYNNLTTGNSSVIAGGKNNIASGNYSVAGGASNVAGGLASVVSGGQNNSVVGDYSTVVGGLNNVITLDYKVKGGEDNPIIAFLNKKIPQYAYIGGGKNNQINKSYSVITGGEENKIAGIFGTISGGSKNTVSGKAASIGGGQNNKAIGSESMIAGGTFNQTLGHGTAISGGQKNIGKGSFANIGGGQNNLASGQNSVISGGADNKASGHYSGIGGGSDNQALGQASIVGGGQENKAKGSYSCVGSGFGNKAEGDLAVISGGAGNYIESYGSVISGGEFNLIKGSYASIGGGSENKATGKASVIAGGIANEAKSAYSIVIGGKDNKALGLASVSLGGQKNEAIGEGSIAAGTRAKAKHAGTFIFSDRSSNQEFKTTGKNKFMVRAQGGVEFYQDSVGDDSTFLIGVVLDGGSWAHTSDRNKKTNFKKEDPEEILAKLVTIPIQSWQYKSPVGADLKSTRHIGPVAQDFYSIFGYGKDNKHISAVDADGVALASIQGLYKKTKECGDKNKRLAIELQKNAEKVKIIKDQYQSNKKIINELIKKSDSQKKTIYKIMKTHFEQYKNIDSLLKQNQRINKSLKEVEKVTINNHHNRKGLTYGLLGIGIILGIGFQGFRIQRRKK